MSDKFDDIAREGRRCPVYALAGMRILGLSQGSALLAALSLGITNTVIGGATGVAVALVVAYVGEKVSTGREGGFAVQWLSAKATGKFAELFANSWRSAGAIAPPNAQKRYQA